MTNFEKITETPEALGELLASLTVIDSPWEDAFQKAFCAGCGLENCDVVECPHNLPGRNDRRTFCPIFERDFTSDPSAR